MVRSELDPFRLAPLQARAVKPETLLVDYVSDLSLARFQQLPAVVDLFFPRFKGQPGWARPVARAWERNHIPLHARPLERLLAALVAMHHAAAGPP